MHSHHIIRKFRKHYRSETTDAIFDVTFVTSSLGLRGMTAGPKIDRYAYYFCLYRGGWLVGAAFISMQLAVSVYRSTVSSSESNWSAWFQHPIRSSIKQYADIFRVLFGIQGL